MGGHICVDAAQGGLSAVLPFLVLHGGYSYAQVAALVLAANIASAVIQPLFGWLGDKAARPWLMALGVFLAGAGMAAIGVVDSYALIVVAALVSGVGNAMLHPEGGRLANLAGGEGANKARSMSIFSVGGQVGFCVGPLVTVAALTAFGLRGTLVYLAICVPYALLLLAFNRRFQAFGLRDDAAVEAVGGRDRWGAFSLVLATLSARSIIFYGVTSFVPLYMVGVFGQTEEFASLLITLFAGAGAVATLLSSKAAERVGTRALTVACFVVLVAGMAAFAAGASLAVCVCMLALVALGVNLFNPPAITLGQSFVPQHLGMASGLSFGVAVAVGGVVSPALGTFGDAFGLTTVMWALCAAAAVGLAFAIAVARLKD
ncbi:MAG: MFS transporter [Eggerthellaceae bacterium]|nr:MFS transporter [Eggerthellaceae bacterium]